MLQSLSEDYKEYLMSLEFVDRLDARESLYGGRTNATRLYCKVEGKQEIRYVDVASLYPYIMKICRYMLYHPEIITSNFGDISEYFGVAKVKMLAPRGLYHPVLPYRSATGRLKFMLCRTCAEAESLTPCTCTSAERAFLGTYATVEIEEAVKQGYQVVKIYEVYHYSESTRYCLETKLGGLFTEYINTFLKVKVEASGYPHDCQTDAQKQNYVQSYLDKEGVVLDPAKIEFNPGLRLVGKAALNSLWGRLAKRNNLTKTIFAKTPQAFFAIVHNEMYVCKDFHIVNDNTICLEYETKKQMVREDKTTNVILASMTTAYARLKLYEYLKKLGESVLYFDTDSIIYLYDPAKPELTLPLGDFLGDLTNEIPEDTFITEYVSTGAKSYALKLSDGSEICKVRGFTLNYKNSLAINFDVMKEMVSKQEIQNNPNLMKVAIVNERKINRDKKRNILFNRREVKMFKAVYTKRVVQANLSTLPYGY